MAVAIGSVPRLALADSWTTVAPLSGAREGLGAVGLPDGRIVAVGGHRGPSFFSLVEIYDPASGKWSVATAMPTPRAGQASALAQDGSVYVAGGFDGERNLNSFVMYDPKSDIRSEGPPMPTARPAPLAAPSAYAVGQAQVQNTVV